MARTPEGCRFVLLLATSLLAACGESSAMSTAASDPSSSPVYYVDGARPSPGLNTGPALAEDEYDKGCVPWSKDRPDVLVCGPIDGSFVPPPAPGDYTDYPEVCEAAAKLFADQAVDLMTANGLTALPQIDTKTCGAAGLVNDRWLVKFGIANPADVSPFASAIVQGFKLGADPGSFFVHLLETPWPAS